MQRRGIPLNTSDYARLVGSTSHTTDGAVRMQDSSRQPEDVLSATPLDADEDHSQRQLAKQSSRSTSGNCSASSGTNNGAGNSNLATSVFEQPYQSRRRSWWRRIGGSFSVWWTPVLPVSSVAESSATGSLAALALGLVVLLAVMVQPYVTSLRARPAVEALKSSVFTATVGNLNELSIEFFTAPKPFVGVDRENQLRAVRSWLALHPRPKITLLGDGEGYDEVAAEYGLAVDRRVDTNFLGVPLFNTMLERANSSNADVVVLLNSDIVVFEDAFMVIGKVQREIRNFLLIGARWDVASVPDGYATSLDANTANVESGNAHSQAAMEDRKLLLAGTNNIVNEVRERGTLHTYGGIDLWAWEPGGPPLFDGHMPPFVYGRGKYDNWFTHEVIFSAARQVVDASEAMTLMHVSHDYHLVAEEHGSISSAPGHSTALDVDVDRPRSAVAAQNSQPRTLKDADKTGLLHAYWNERLQSSFEAYVNNFLSRAYGTYRNHMGTVLHAPIKIASCYEAVPFCAIRRVRPHACRCEYSGFVDHTQSDPFTVTDSRVIFCGQEAADRENEQFDRLSGRIHSEHTADGFRSRENGTVEPAFGFPLTLHALRPLLADERGALVLTAVNANDRVLLDHFVCNLRVLNVNSLLVAAFDDSLYQHAVVRGYGVYLEDSVFESEGAFAQMEEISRNSPDAHLLRQARLRTVLRIVSLGNSVLLSDVDVLWLRDPRQELWAQVKAARADAAILSAARAGEAQNSRLDAAFMLVRAGAGGEALLRTAIALCDGDEVLSDSHAILLAACGEDGSKRQNEQLCVTGESTLLVLQPRQFSNSASQPALMRELEEGGIERLLSLEQLYVLRNNADRTSTTKVARLESTSALLVDRDRQICLHGVLR